MMGDGYLVRPEEGMAYAPEDATVSFIFHQTCSWSD